MIDRKNAVTRFRLWLRTFIESITIDQKYESVHYVRPSLEALEDRTLLSASVGGFVAAVLLGIAPAGAFLDGRYFVHDIADERVGPIG